VAAAEADSQGFRLRNYCKRISGTPPLAAEELALLRNAGLVGGDKYGIGRAPLPWGILRRCLHAITEDSRGRSTIAIEFSGLIPPPPPPRADMNERPFHASTKDIRGCRRGWRSTGRSLWTGRRR